MDEKSPSQNIQENLFKRILEAFRLSRSLDTAEDLEHEIHELIEDGEEHGLISSYEGEMISSIFEFRETLIKEIMTPGSDIIRTAVETSPKEVIELIKEHGLSRIPIFSQTPDQIIGILHAKDLLISWATQGEDSLEAMASPPFFVQENQQIISLLRDFQKKNTHMAIVTDEFGSIRGLVTLEDILEEIVGEIEDESDKPEEQWQVIDEYTVITDGKVNLEEVENFFDVLFPEGPYESVGGFITDQIGRVAEQGTEIQFDSLSFTVISASQRRIESVKIHQAILT